jgi:hypothetical protein
MMMRVSAIRTGDSAWLVVQFTGQPACLLKLLGRLR